jgi:GNAT superfamily N-acetyltransferase
MIRAATFDDLPALVEVARAYHDELHASLPFDPDHVGENFRARTIDTVDGICFCLLDDEVRIAGFLAAATSMHFSAPVKLGVELAWYVLPAQRGRGAGLIDEYEAWAKWRGYAGCSLSMNELRDPARSRALARLYERRGYIQFERCFLKSF